MKDLGLDTAQLGIIFSSFFAGYALFTFIGGYAADIFGPKRVFAVAMTVWSAFCGLTATAVGFTSLLVIRTMFGFGEGPFGATANKIVRNWFPRHQAATGVGIANAGTPVGGALAGPVAGWLTWRYGWRTSFVVLACLGVIWTFFWILFVADRPETHRGLSDPERDEVERDRFAIVQDETKLPLSFYLRQPAVIATGVSFFGYAYILYFFLSWFPSYLMMERHLTLRDMGAINTVPWILGTIGLTMSGLACDALSHMCREVLQARKLVLVVCLILGAVFVSLAGLVSGLSWAVAFMAASIFFIYLTGATYWAILQETVASQHIGAASGFVHLIANGAGIVGPAVTGFIVRATGIFTSAFLLAGAVAFLGALLVVIFVRSPKRHGAGALVLD